MPTLPVNSSLSRLADPPPTQASACFVGSPTVQFKLCLICRSPAPGTGSLLLWFASQVPYLSCACGKPLAWGINPLYARPVCLTTKQVNAARAGRLSANWSCLHGCEGAATFVTGEGHCTACSGLPLPNPLRGQWLRRLPPLSGRSHKYPLWCVVRCGNQQPTHRHAEHVEPQSTGTLVATK